MFGELCLHGGGGGGGSRISISIFDLILIWFLNFFRHTQGQVSQRTTHSTDQISDFFAMLANDILRGTHAHVGDDGFDFDRYENVNERMNNVSHMPMSWYQYTSL